MSRMAPTDKPVTGSGVPLWLLIAAATGLWVLAVVLVWGALATLVADGV